MEKDFYTRQEVLDRLDIKPATLYSYVSRGLIKSIPQADRRKSLYSREDVERLGARRRGRIGRTAAAESSMRWGEPVVDSGITQITPTGPVYRNKPAVELARSGASFEAVAHLLFTGVWQEQASAWPLIATPEDMKPMLATQAQNFTHGDIGNVLGAVVLTLGMRGRGGEEIADGSSVAAARLILQTLTGCLGLLSPSGRFCERVAGETVAEHLIRAAGGTDSPEARRALNASLIVLADHELAAATFAARLAASANANLYNCVAAAICAHLGFTIGGAPEKVDSVLLGDLNPKQLETALDLVRDYGANLFGFNHPLYVNGDPRVELILGLLEPLIPPKSPLRRAFRLLDTARQSGAYPGVAVALALLARALQLPPGSATALWVVARSVGWVAHSLEQRVQAFMLRPRAKYASQRPG